MKLQITLILMLAVLVSVVQAQLTKPKSKESDSIIYRSSQVFPPLQKPKPRDPFVLMMPVDSNNNAPVKMPNSYRSWSNIKPAPMPTLKIGNSTAASKELNDQGKRFSETLKRK